MKFWNKLFDGKILNIKYENLISKPNEKIKELINFCELNGKINV